MRSAASFLFLLAVLTGMSSSQTITFPLMRSHLDTSKAIRVLESYADLDSIPKELIKAVPTNVSDISYITFHVSRADDSLLTAIRTTDSAGNTIYFFDSNNDEDLSNESPYRITDQPIRVPFSYNDNIGSATVTRWSNLILTEVKQLRPEYRLDELWEARLSVGGEAISLGIQRFFPDLPMLFLDSREIGIYDRPFFAQKEVLGLGGRFYRVKVNFPNEVLHLEETQQLPVDAGFPAPDFQARMWNSNIDFKLSSQKGKVVLITFWHPSCPGSRAEAPSYDSLRSDFDSTSVAFLAVTTDSLLLGQYVRQHRHSYTHIVDSRLWDLYGVTAPFVTFLIDRNGTISRRQFMYTAEIRHHLEQLLSGK